MTKSPTKLTVLFIDTGDNCRCPMACGYLYKLLRQRGITHINIKTCGAMTPTGLLATPETVRLLADEGIDIASHRSKPMTAALLQEADLILAMSPYHVTAAIRKSASCSTKIILLKEYTGFPTGNYTILDPMGGSMKIYKKIFDEIKMALNQLVEMQLFTNAPDVCETAP